MSVLTETYTLANGVQIPKLGLGTWFIDDDRAADAVRTATEIGYRNIDTAQAYGNERGVGEGVRTSGVARTDLFVSTKLAAEIKDYDHAAAAIDASLATLDIGYIDLMLIHAPQPWDDFRGGDYSEGNQAAWRALEDAHNAGKLRAIGVSNFLQADLDNILQRATVAPQVNQILVHAGNTPTDLIAYCRGKNILVDKSDQVDADAQRRAFRADGMPRAVGRGDSRAFPHAALTPKAGIRRCRPASVAQARSAARWTRLGGSGSRLCC